MNQFGKFLLVLTSLSPVMLGYAVNSYSQGSNAAYYYGVLGGGSGVVCLLLIHFCKANLQVQTLTVKKVKTVDKQALAFLVIYLMPLFTNNAIDFAAHPMTAAYVLVTIGIVVYHTNAFAFNPVLALMRYHFYEIEAESGMTYLFVTRKVLQSQDGKYKAVKIGNYVFMDRD